MNFLSLACKASFILDSLKFFIAGAMTSSCQSKSSSSNSLITYVINLDGDFGSLPQVTLLRDITASIALGNKSKIDPDLPILPEDILSLTKNETTQKRILAYKKFYKKIFLAKKCCFHSNS